MRSKLAFTKELDDLALGVSQLVNQLADFPRLTNTVGIMMVDADIYFPELQAQLAKQFDFPIIGMSTTAILHTRGLAKSGLALLVLTADDCAFRAGITDELNDENYKEKLSALYGKLHRDDDPEKLIIGFATPLTGMVGDILLEAIDDMTGGVPFFGGLAADFFTFEQYRVFSRDGQLQSGAVLLLVSGNVRPQYVSSISAFKTTRFSAKVTKAEKNVLYEMSNGKFLDVLEREGMGSPNTEVFMDYLTTPFVTTQVAKDGERFSVLRNLAYLDHNKKSGTFLGKIRKGEPLELALVRKEDIRRSAQESVDRIMAEINEISDYHYSTLLCNSCSARYLNLVTEPDIESQAYRDILPADMELLGGYGYGEYCPEKGAAHDHYHNIFHNCAFTAIAL